MRLPVIGLTVDQESAGGYSSLPWYALRCNYAGAVSAAGAIPLLLPHERRHTQAYLDRLDGLMVTGGAFDVDPALFGATTRHDTVSLKPGRTDFELAMVRSALARDMPLFGICGGQQLLHVALGGRLVQHIPDEIPGALAHEQSNPRTEPGHEVAVTPGTRLADIVGTGPLRVNSAHHQAAADEPPGVVVNARAPDGVIEGIEAPGYRFCLGVQWHPEYHVDPGDARLVEAFVTAARDAMP